MKLLLYLEVIVETGQGMESKEKRLPSWTWCGDAIKDPLKRIEAKPSTLIHLRCPILIVFSFQLYSKYLSGCWAV